MASTKLFFFPLLHHKQYCRECGAVVTMAGAAVKARLPICGSATRDDATKIIMQVNVEGFRRFSRDW